MGLVFCYMLQYRAGLSCLFKTLNKFTDAHALEEYVTRFLPEETLCLVLRQGLSTDPWLSLDLTT